MGTNALNNRLIPVIFVVHWWNGSDDCEPTIVGAARSQEGAHAAIKADMALNKGREKICYEIKPIPLTD